MDFLINQNISEALFQSILHSLWQLPLCILGLKVFSKYFLPPSLRRDYYANLFGLGLGLISALLTFSFFIYQGTSPGLIVNTLSGSEQMLDYVVGTNYSASSEAITIAALQPYVVISWLIGMMLFSLKAILGLWAINRIRKNIDFNISEQLKTQFEDLKKLMGLKSVVRLGLSSYVQAPMMIGHFKPIVILPLAMLNQLTEEETESILIHELAHIANKDYVKNMIVVAAEILFFYHPIIWYATNQIKQQREHTCDETVVKIQKNPLNYAKVLLKVETLFQANANSFSMQLFTTKFKLMNRVKRILNMTNETKDTSSRIGVIALLLMSSVIFTSAVILQKDGDPSLAIEENQENIINNLKEGNNLPLISTDEEEVKTEDLTAKLKNIFNLESRPIISIDTLPDEERKLLKEKLRSHREEMKMKKEQLREKLAATREQFQEEYSKDLEEKREEMKRLKKMLGEDSATFEEDMQIFDEDMKASIEEFSLEMAELGMRIGQEVSETFNEEWAEDLRATFEETFDEDFENRMEEMGARLEETFDEDFEAKMEALSERIEHSFDKEAFRELENARFEVLEEMDGEWIESIAEMGRSISEEVIRALEEADIDVDDDVYIERDGKRFRRLNKSARAKERAHEEENRFMQGDDNSYNFKKALIKELNNENLLKNGKNKIVIEDEEMKVNGKRLSQDQLEKYQAITKRFNENAFKDGKTKVEIKFKGKDINESSKTSVSISISN